MTNLILGIDGGGSKTLALVADPDGTILGRGTAASSNYQSVGFPAAKAAVDAAIAAALADANRDPASSFAAACLGFAGVDRPADYAFWEEWLHARQLAERLLVVNDARLLLAAGTPEGWGVALICGTGSICYGRTRDGTTARAGGWGYLLGDEGSGYTIAVEALRLAVRTADERADAHALLAALLDECGFEEPRVLIKYVYRPGITRADIAALAPRVAAIAEAGDTHAQAILDRAAAELGDLIRTVTRKLDLHEPPLALGGGFIGAHQAFQAAVIARAGINLGPVKYVVEPALGALVLARRLLDSPGTQR